MDDMVSRQAAINHLRSIIDATDTKDRYNEGFADGLEFCISHMATMPSVHPEQKAEELLPDGTLHFCTDTDLSKVTRVWVSQNGTHYGDLYYADGETERCNRTDAVARTV